MTTSPIPAATLILFRDTPEGAEHLFVERASTMAFAAGAIVFPGGRVDPGDRRLAALVTTIDLDDAAARIAAIRETIEEAGIAVALYPQPRRAVVARLRAGLARGTAFEQLLAEEELALDLQQLIPFARWCPNFAETRTFDTRFYLARAPDDGHQASVDATENVHVFWDTAAALLARAAAGALRIIFPTRRNLERLATLTDLAAAEAHVRAHPVELIVPRVEDRDGVAWLTIPTHLGYPVTAELLETVRRG